MATARGVMPKETVADFSMKRERKREGEKRTHRVSEMVGRKALEKLADVEW